MQLADVASERAAVAVGLIRPTRGRARRTGRHGIATSHQIQALAGQNRAP